MRSRSKRRGALSILIVTKNAEDVIGRALASLRGLGNELVVIDSGSTDETVSIVRKFTNNISTYAFEQDFSKLRNYGLSKVVGDWVLVLDSDEQISEKANREIPNLIKNRTVDGYWFRRQTFIMPNRYLHYGLFYPDWQLRLFRKNKGYRYHGTVHEQLEIPKEKTIEIPYDILHYPQHQKYSSFKDFFHIMPYIKISSEELAKSSKGFFVLIFSGIFQSIYLFGGGFFRGKGFLDGWDGLRAHVIFASSIAFAYIMAAWKKAKGKFCYEIHAV